MVAVGQLCVRHKYSRSCELDTVTLPRVLYIERPLWAGFARGAARLTLDLPTDATPGCTLTRSYLVCGASLLLN